MFTLSSFRSVACAALCALAAGFTASASATPMPNPAPFLLFDDTEAELVTPTAQMNAQFVTNTERAFQVDLRPRGPLPESRLGKGLGRRVSSEPVGSDLNRSEAAARAGD